MRSIQRVVKEKPRNLKPNPPTTVSLFTNPSLLLRSASTIRIDFSESINFLSENRALRRCVSSQVGAAALYGLTVEECWGDHEAKQTRPPTMSTAPVVSRFGSGLFPCGRRAFRLRNRPPVHQ